jgi:uncharacterized membrane protein YciS (DUF1049 family)
MTTSLKELLAALFIVGIVAFWLLMASGKLF